MLTILWLYHQTEDAKLLELARLLRRQGYDWTGEFADFPYKNGMIAESLPLELGGHHGDVALATHGVNNGQAIETGPVWSIVSGSQRDREAASHMIAQLDQYHDLPKGMFPVMNILQAEVRPRDRSFVPLLSPCSRRKSLLPSWAILPSEIVLRSWRSTLCPAR